MPKEAVWIGKVLIFFGAVLLLLTCFHQHFSGFSTVEQACGALSLVAFGLIF